MAYRVPWHLTGMVMSENSDSEASGAPRTVILPVAPTFPLPMFSALRNGSKSPPVDSGLGRVPLPCLPLGFGKLTVASFFATSMRFVYVLGKHRKVTEAQETKR